MVLLLHPGAVEEGGFVVAVDWEEAGDGSGSSTPLRQWVGHYELSGGRTKTAANLLHQRQLIDARFSPVCPENVVAHALRADHRSMILGDACDWADMRNEPTPFTSFWGLLNDPSPSTPLYRVCFSLTSNLIRQCWCSLDRLEAFQLLLKLQKCTMCTLPIQGVK